MPHSSHGDGVRPRRLAGSPHGRAQRLRPAPDVDAISILYGGTKSSRRGGLPQTCRVDPAGGIIADSVLEDSDCHDKNQIGLRGHVVRRICIDAMCGGPGKAFAGPRVPLWRGLFPQIEPAGTGLGARPQDRGPDGHQHLPSLVHVGLDRELAGQVRLARLRPHGGTRSSEPHQGGHRRNHPPARPNGCGTSIPMPAISAATVPRAIRPLVGSSATGSAPALSGQRRCPGPGREVPDRAGGALSRQSRHSGLRRVERGGSAENVIAQPRRPSSASG